MNPIVSPDWLAARLKEPDLRILDADWYLPAEGTTGAAEYAREHLPGAVFFDIDAIADKSTDLPHMLPSAERFAEMVGALGVGAGDRIVVYDHYGLRSAARAWWMFRVMGHSEVFVLDGGLPRWKAEGHPVTDHPAVPVDRTFEARLDPRLVKSWTEVRAALATGGQVVDGRAPDRFAGSAPEPRPGLRAGHMPGALNLPFAGVLKDGSMRNPAEIEAVFKAAGVDIDQPVTTSCGSGIVACVLALGLARTGRWDAAVYDGSWTEWGGRRDTEVVTG
jgi:thiosulfate/3-mercaptopyruvate sulfurtransferase